MLHFLRAEGHVLLHLPFAVAHMDHCHGYEGGLTLFNLLPETATLIRELLVLEQTQITFLMSNPLFLTFLDAQDFELFF